MGKATESIIRAAADFVPDAVKLNAAQYLEHGKPIQLGPFTILPRLVDLCVPKTLSELMP
jgi:ribonuclease J